MRPRELVRLLLYDGALPPSTRVVAAPEMPIPTLADALFDAVAVLDLDGSCSYANPPMLRLLGCVADDLPRAPIWPRLDAGTRRRVEEAFVRVAGRPGAREDVTTNEGEVRLLRAGEQVYVVVRPNADRAEVLAARGEALAARRALTDVQRRLDAVIEQLPVALIVAEAPTGKLVVSNAQVERVWGQPFVAAADVAAYRGYVGYHPDGRPYLPAEWPLARALARGETVRGEELQFRRGDGTIGWMETNAAPIRDEDGSVLGAVVVFWDITETKDRTAALEEARANAEAASRGKDEFLAVLGHELRTPLHAIQGWAQILRQPGVGPERVARGLDTIERNTRLMGHIVDDLLDIAGTLAGKLALRVGPVDLHGAVAAALEAVRPWLEAKNIRAAIRSVRRVPLLSGDGDRLQQVVWNVLANAAKFTPDGGAIAIRIDHDGARASVEVVDTGCGIAPEFLPHVFERFRQADASRTRRVGGLGLGLAISRSVIDLHRGAIAVRSDGEGRGTTVRIELPLDAPAASSAATRT